MMHAELGLCSVLSVLTVKQLTCSSLGLLIIVLLEDLMRIMLYTSIDELLVGMNKIRFSPVYVAFDVPFYD